MLPAVPPVGRLLLIAGLLALSLAACGRRGALEAPPDATAATQQRQVAARQGEDVTDDEGDAEPAPVASPVPTPRKRSKAITIPKEPFILDPLL
jgi:predicted small lipoprotein YifL